MSVKKKCVECGYIRKIPTNRERCQYCRALPGRVKRGEVRPPDYEHITIEKYKQPMIKVENGFGYIGAITETTDDN